MSNNYSVGGGGRGGGVGAVALGPAQNEFGTTTTASKAAAQTLRNTYATANADWLALYNGDRSFFIRLIWLNNAQAFQRRNAAGTAWEDVTTLAPGTRGASASLSGKDSVELFNNIPTGETALAMANEWSTANRNWGNAIEIDLGIELVADHDSYELEFHGAYEDSENSNRRSSFAVSFPAARFRRLAENDAADTATTIEDGIHIAASRTSETSITGWGQMTWLVTRARSAAGNDVIKMIPWAGREFHFVNFRCQVLLIPHPSRLS